jgi:hypothetical protein
MIKKIAEWNGSESYKCLYETLLIKSPFIFSANVYFNDTYYVLEIFANKTQCMSFQAYRLMRVTESVKQ